MAVLASDYFDCTHCAFNLMDKTKMQMGDCSEGCRGWPGATRHIFLHRATILTPLAWPRPVASLPGGLGPGLPGPGKVWPERQYPGAGLRPCGSQGSAVYVASAGAAFITLLTGTAMRIAAAFTSSSTNQRVQAHIIPIIITLAFLARCYAPQIHCVPRVACRAAWLLVFVLSWFRFWHSSVNYPTADSD